LVAGLGSVFAMTELPKKETGRYDPSLPLAFRIAKVFHKPIEAIFTPGK
jgi:DNA-binding XRE family transcriptional regulator